MSNILHLVSIARKAGKLEVGEEPTAAAARARHAKLILVAKDAAENTYRRVWHLGQAGNVTWISTPYTKAELGGAVGRSSCAMLAVMDIGLAAAMVRGLAEDAPEKFNVTMERMNAKAEKALRRQQEKRQHEKNIKTGKYQRKHRAKQAQGAPRSNQTKGEGEAPAREPEAARPRPSGRPKDKKRTGSAPMNHSGRRRHTKGSGRSNRYEEYGPTGRPSARRYQKHRES